MNAIIIYHLNSTHHFHTVVPKETLFWRTPTDIGLHQRFFSSNVSCYQWKTLEASSSRRFYYFYKLLFMFSFFFSKSIQCKDGSFDPSSVLIPALITAAESSKELATKVSFLLIISLSNKTNKNSFQNILQFSSGIFSLCWMDRTTWRPVQTQKRTWNPSCSSSRDWREIRIIKANDWWRHRQHFHFHDVMNILSFPFFFHLFFSFFSF